MNDTNTNGHSPVKDYHHQEPSQSQIIDKVKDYYANQLASTQDLKTSACCSLDALPKRLREILATIKPEILDKFYGCGSPLPVALHGQTVLDLGCGSGRDVYLASKLVGPNGFVIGVDMTEEQLKVAKDNLADQMRIFGFDPSKPNVDFRQGLIEDLLNTAHIQDASIDVVISNCVINLSPNKDRVLSEIFRVLKPGGELYFSDVFASRRIPNQLKHDPVLYGECLAGALYIEDFRRILVKVGCPDYRVISSRLIDIVDEDIRAKCGNIQFYSKTIRAFKLSQHLEDLCEDYGQVAIYNGALVECPTYFTLDDHHLFEKGKPVLICGNTAAMLQQTRFAPYFTIIGDTSVHYGIFDCNPNSTDDSRGSNGPCC